MLQGAYPADLDANYVASGQGEVISRNDSGAGEENRAVRKRLTAEQIAYQFVEIAFDIGDGSFAFKDGFLSPLDLQLDDPRSRFGFISANTNERPKRAGAIINFGLGQIEEILAFDVTRTHVIADSESRDLSARINNERQFGLRHIPLC